MDDLGSYLVIRRLKAIFSNAPAHADDLKVRITEWDFLKTHIFQTNEKFGS